jgi:hypothetical protein
MDDCFLASPYFAVYGALRRSLDTGGNVVVGTESILSHTRHWLLAEGDRDCAESLERLAVEVTRLQLALRANDEAAAEVSRCRLQARLADWLLTCPMLAVAAIPALRMAA